MRVLAIDGGGIRGIVPALVLADLERRTGRRVHELFDLVAGTSTGGILACALTRPDPPSAAEVVALYERDGARIFHRSLLRRIETVDGNIDERYDSSGLLAVLREHLGAARLSQALTSILVTAYELEGRFAFFFRSARATADPAADFGMVDVAHATSAAPTYFEPAAVRDLAGARTYALIDGGVFATNPAMCAVAELAHVGAAPGIELLLSLGTGAHTRPIHLADARGWGRLEWAPRIVDVVFDGVAETVDFEAAQLLGERYLRMQTDLVGASDDLDDASPRNVAALRAVGERMVRDRAEDLARVAAILGR